MNRRSRFPTPIVLLLLLALPQAVPAAAADQEEASPGRRAAVSDILRTGFGQLLQIFEEIVKSSGSQRPATELEPGMLPQGNQGQAGEGDLGPGMDPWG
jgi:hypothetical protein